MFPKAHGISPTHHPLLDSNDPSLDTTAKVLAVLVAPGAVAELMARAQPLALHQHHETTESSVVWVEAEHG